MKKVRKRKPVKNSLAMRILKGVGLASSVLIAVTSPYFGLNAIKGFIKYYDKKAWRKFYASLNYLNRRGYVRILRNQDGEIETEITQRGKSIINTLDIDLMELPKSGRWDGKWRVVIFDVPNFKNKNRLAFTEKLKKLGFIMVQKSVWAYPFKCYKEIMILRKLYEIERYVSYFEGIGVEDELNWRGKFNLKAGVVAQDIRCCRC